MLDWNTPSIEFYDRLGAANLTDWNHRRLTGAPLAGAAERWPREIAS